MEKYHNFRRKYYFWKKQTIVFGAKFEFDVNGKVIIGVCPCIGEHSCK